MSATASHIERLNRIGIALSSETDLGRLLHLIVTEARGFTRADAGSLYTLEGETLYFRVAQNDTLDTPGSGRSFKPVPIPLSAASIAGYVALSGELLHIDDVYALPEGAPYRFNADYDRQSGYRTRSMLVVPMKDPDGAIVGVIQLINAKDREGRAASFSRQFDSLNLSLASQAAVAIRNARLIAYIKGLFEALIRYSASAIDARSPHTAGHSRRVAAYSLIIARAIHAAPEGPFAEAAFSRERLDRLAYAAWLHDIGKIGVPENILDKRYRLPPGRESVIESRFCLAAALKELAVHRSGAEPAALDEARRYAERLQAALSRIMAVNAGNWLSEPDRELLDEIARETYTDAAGNQAPLLLPDEFCYLGVQKGNLTAEEYGVMQGHVLHTLRIVENIPFTGHLARVPEIASSHHEMLDGSGYPRKLTAERIPLEARILAMVDIFDALTAMDRPYRKAMPPEKACGILLEEARAGRLDADIVNLFVDKRLYEKLSDELAGQGEAAA